MPVPLLPPPAPAVMPEMPEADTDSQQNSPAQGTCKPQQQQQPGQEQQLGEQLVAQSGKGGMPLAQPAAADVGAVAAVAAEGSGAAVQPAVQPCAAGGKPKADEHDDNTAAALLLGMGSKSESDGGGSAGSSGRNRTKADGASVAGVAGAARRRQLERSTSNGAAAANGAGGKAPDAEDESEEEEEEEEQQQIGKGRGKGRRGSSGSLRRSTRRGRTPAYRASELLGSGSDDEFEPGTKRVPKPAAGMARTPTAAAVPAKSELTLLCERFQQQFGHLQPDGSPNSLMLNDVAEALGVPRRRLYDVINVFESIEVMRRVGKLMYEWVGFDHLPGLLEQLAEDETNGVPVEDRIRRAPTLIIVNEQGEEIGSGKGNSHSLWVLSRRLVRMLLKQEGPIALTAAAAVLVGPGGVSDPSKHRSQTQITVERRLYDIGSILCSVGLLERIYMKKRQPAFDWIYGWRPGDSHDPPKLPNRLANADEDDGGRAEASASRAGRKRAAKAAVAGPASAECDVKKARSAADLSAEAMAAAAASCGIPMGGMPFGMPFGHVMMAPGMGGMAMTAGGAGASPAMFMGGMAGLAPMGDDKSGVMNGMAGMHMAPFFAPPGAFFANPMMQMGGMNGMSGMNGINGMATPAAAAAAAEPSPADPQGASAAGSGAQGDAAMGSVRSGMDEGAAAAAAANAAANGGMGGAPPGMMMWHPQMAMMNPAMMQQYQMQQAAMMKSSDQMQQQAAAAAAAAGSKPMAAGGGMAGGGHFSGGMMMPAGMMMGYGHPMMQPGMMQPNFVPVSAGNNGMQQQQQQQQ